MIPPTRLFDCAQSLLDKVGSYYAEHNIDLPERRYVSPGTPAWDCEQVVVYVERTSSGGVDTEDTGLVDCLVVRSALLVVEVARCVPTADTNADQIVLPTPAEETAAARCVLADPVMLVNAAVDGFRDGDLAGCRGLAIVEWEALGPDAGLAGGRQRIRWQLTEG